MNEFFRIFLALLFIVSAAAKFLEPISFRSTLEQLKLPAKLVAAASIAVPAGEAVICFMLLFGSLFQWAAVGTISLCAAFGWSLWQAQRQKKSIECNCFGSLTEENFGWMTAARIGLLLVVSVYLLLGRTNQADVWSIGWENTISCVLSAMGIILLYAMLLNYFKLGTEFRLKALSTKNGGKT